MATSSPRPWSEPTIRSLCSGEVRAKTDTSEVARSSSSSLSRSTSAPVRTRPSVVMPSSPAIAAAVTGWSPVIMIVRMPASREVVTAAATSVRGGSIMPIRPRKTRSCSTTGSSSSGTRSRSRCATPSSRSPCAAIRSPAACRPSGRTGSVPDSATWASHIASTRSGAPLTNRTSRSPQRRAVAEKRRAGSKCTSAVFGNTASRAACSSPASWAASSSATSVGSPQAWSVPSSARVRASLVNAPHSSTRW